MPPTDSSSASHMETQKPAAVFPGRVRREAAAVLCALFSAVLGNGTVKWVLLLGEKLSAVLL